jgi:uroporphyrinogen decarboxylase
LGFAGAPFTLASYMIEGGASKTFRRTKTWMYRRPSEWKALLEKIADAAGALLKLQAEAGAQAVLFFDSWAGALGPDDYRTFAAPYTARAIAHVPRGTPVIHFGTGNPALLADMAQAGGDAIGADYRIGLADAWKLIGPSKAIQGNLDPLVLCGERDFIRERAKRVLDEAAGRPGHIFNLGHGVLPETPPENARYLVEIVRELSAKR